MTSDHDQRNRALDAESSITARRESHSFELLLNNARVQRRKARQAIDLEDEVFEIRPIDLDKGNVIDIEEVESDLENDIFHTGDAEQFQRRDDNRRLRNPAIKTPLRKIDIVTSRSGARLKVGDTVELTNGRFLEITTLVEHTDTRAVTLRGWDLRRTTDLAGELIRKLNELCYMIEVDLDDSRPMQLQSVIEVGLNSVKKVRALIRTNYHFPAYRFNLEELPPGDEETKRRFVLNESVLVVRWQHITIFRNAKDRETQSQYCANFHSRKLVPLHKRWCDNDHYLPPSVLRYQWREDERLRRHGERDKSDGAKMMDPVIQRVTTGSAARPICIDVSEDEVSKGKAVNITTSTRVSIDIFASDFAQADPRKFMENIRQRFEAQVPLNLEKNKQPLPTRKASQNDTLSAILKACSPSRQDRLAISKTATGHQYSYGDACESLHSLNLALTNDMIVCGAGGATQGAIMAGLRVAWGLDFSPDAAETWRYNFPQAKMYEMWANELCTLSDPEGKLIVEVLHLSPPCQVWSPAHTRPGRDDDMNFASLYAVQALIAKARPRIVTLEQTFGIMHKRFRLPMNNLIRMLTDHNFSVSWQILELERLGLPQKRKRLIIVAAASVFPRLPRAWNSY